MRDKLGRIDKAIQYIALIFLCSIIMRDSYNPNDYSIGIIWYCQTDLDIHYLLIHHTKWHRAFPKGHSEWNEESRETALRELREETWVTQVTLWDTIYTEHYEFDHKWVHVTKQVDYFLGHCDQCQPTTIQPEETIEAWRYTYNEAIKLLTFEESKNLLKQVHYWLNFDAIS